MKCFWLRKQNDKKKLVVFFAGWSFDENPFLGTNCKDYGKDYDVLMVYDYNDLSVPNELKDLSQYSEKYLITWSMGVFVAYKFRDLFADFTTKIAVNGTVTPVDDEYGIPKKIFELTFKHAQKGLEGKFYQNLFDDERLYSEIFSKFRIERTIENRVSELENLYDLIKNERNTEYQQFYDFAIVSEFDKIIPPQNQIAGHKKNNVQVIKIPYGHFPYYNIGSWDEIIKCRQTSNK